MRALVLQHVAIEGPGTLAPYLEARGWTLETVALYAGARPPEDARGYQAVIVMGGPMGVYDEAAYPFLRAEQHFLSRAMAQDVPLLGICLGSQLRAKALGARVYRNAQKEIGWYTVDLTPAGAADPLFDCRRAPAPLCGIPTGWDQSMRQSRRAPLGAPGHAAQRRRAAAVLIKCPYDGAVVKRLLHIKTAATAASAAAY